MRRNAQHLPAGWFKSLAWSAAVGLLLVAGCLETYGRLAPSQEVDRQFEAARVLPDHHYFYAGGQNDPRAIMGIHKDYRQTNRSWTPVPGITGADLKKKVAAMTRGIGRSGQICGGVLQGPDGKPVGVWYSKSRDVTLRFDENGGVSVGLPRWPDEERERRSKFITP